MGDEGISTGVSDQLKRFEEEVLVLGFDSRRPTTLLPPMTHVEVLERYQALSLLTKVEYSGPSVCED